MITKCQGESKIDSYNDITITCCDCGEDFIFSAGEQEFYAEHGLYKQPVRCRECRAGRKLGRMPQKRRTVLYEIVCARCGAIESIPFEPRHDRPVYCVKCYKEITGRL